ncbi:hypothetical protein ACLB2K_055425 [Fragaria x ananassa]
MLSSSAETVVNIEELLRQILERVPPLSLITFKCVSKHWLSLISDPEFRRCHTLRNHNPKISSFFPTKIKDENLLKSPFKTLNSAVSDGSNIGILQSCNGLFLCYALSGEQTKHHVYVVNPSTNQFRGLSSPSVSQDKHTFVRYALAFDPSKSPHYKVVCVFNHPMYSKEEQLKTDIYSSETGEWEHLETPFFHGQSYKFNWKSRLGAVYCNGALHWIRKKRKDFHFSYDRKEFTRHETDVLHYFEVSQERMLVVSATTPVPSVVKNIPVGSGYWQPTMWPILAQRYFGECGGRLYLIETYEHCLTQFDVMEMERDYSGWFVKYNVDLNPLAAALPGQDWDPLIVLCLSQEEETYNTGFEDSSVALLLHLPDFLFHLTKWRLTAFFISSSPSKKLRKRII